MSIGSTAQNKMGLVSSLFKAGGDAVLPHVAKAINTVPHAVFTQAYQDLHRLLQGLVEGQDPIPNVRNKVANSLEAFAEGLNQSDPSGQALYENIAHLTETLKNPRRDLFKTKEQKAAFFAVYDPLTEQFSKTGWAIQLTKAATDWLLPWLGLPGFHSSHAGARALQLTPPAQKPFKDAHWEIWKLNDRASDEKSGPLPPTEAKQIAEILKSSLPLPIADDELKPISLLIATLGDQATSLNLKSLRPLIQQVYGTFSRVRLDNTGIIEIGVENVAMSTFRFFNNWKLAPPAPQSLPKASGWKIWGKAELPLTQPEKPIDKPTAIQHQIELLYTNSSRLLVGYFIFSLCKINPVEEGKGNFITNLIQETNPSSRVNQGTNSDLQFTHTLEAKIENSDISLWRKWLCKTALKIGEPLIFYFVKHFITNIAAAITYWTQLPPADRLKTLQAGLIKPVIEYLTSLLKAIHELFNHKTSIIDLFKGVIGLQTAPTISATRGLATDITKAVTALQTKEGLFLPGLISNFTNFILSFVPTLNWTQKAQSLCQEKGESGDRFTKYLWLSYANFFATLEWAIFPIQAIINRSIKFFLSRTLKSALSSLINKNTTDGLHAHYIKDVILKNLKKANEETNRAQKTPLTDLDIMNQVPTGIENEIFQVFELFRQVLDLQFRSHQVEKSLNQDPTSTEPSEMLIKNVPLTPFKPLVSSQIIPLLQSIIEQNLLEDVWLEVLTKINEAGFKPKSSLPLDSYTQFAVEKEMRKELDIFFKQKMEEAKHDLFNPQEYQQKICQTYLAGCQQGTAKLSQQFQEGVLKNEEIKKLWISLKNEMTRHKNNVQEKLTDDGQGKVEKFFKQFSTQSHQLDSMIEQLTLHTENKKELVSTCDALDKFIKTLQQVQETPTAKPLDELAKQLKVYVFPEELKGLPMDSFKRQFRDLNTHKASDLKQLCSHVIPSFLQKIQDAKKATLDTNSKKLDTTIAELRTDIQKEATTFSGWVQKATIPEVHVDPAQYLQVLKPLVNLPGPTAVANLISGGLTDQALEFINQPYHYPLVVQFLLRGFLELPRSQP
jgi:hypothetical protein